MVAYHHVLDCYKVRTKYNAIPDCLLTKPTPAFINVLAGRCCHVNKPTTRLTSSKFVNKRFVSNFVLV